MFVSGDKGVILHIIANVHLLNLSHPIALRVGRAIGADAAECGKAGNSPKCYTGINKLHHVDHTYAVVRNMAIIGKFTLKA